MKNFVIECRYEYRSRNGIIWTDWFVCDPKPVPEDKLKEVLKAIKENSKNTDKVTKLKHEYRELDADIYEARYKEFLERVEEAKKDFATIKKMKKPWQAKAAKERKKLREMPNDEKVEWLARKRKEIKDRV